jgi:hypothetical protein
VKNNRPLLLYGLVVIFFFASFTAILALIGTLKVWNWLFIFDAQPTPIYQVYKNAFLALAWAVAAVILWLRVKWSPKFGAVITIIKLSWFWYDRLWATQNPLPLNRQLFWMVAAILLTGLVLGSLIAIAPYMKNSPDRLDTRQPSTFTKGKPDA